jgi:hypothetical protein
MFRRLLIASVCTSVLAVAAPASAESIPAGKSDRVAAPVKKVVRQYGDGPVQLQEGQQLVLRFRGERGDRVSLGVVYRTRSGNPYYGTLERRDVRVQGRHSEPRPDSTGYFRLPEDGWFSIRYRSAYTQRVQLFKQVRVTHDGLSTTRLPQRRGFQYAVRVRAPRSGLRVVSFGTSLFGVLSEGKYSNNVAGQALVVAPGLPVLGDNPMYGLSEELEPRQQVLVLVNPSRVGSVTTSVPTEVGRAVLDGPAMPLPAGGTQAVVAELEAGDLAASAQRLLTVRVLGTGAAWRDWGVLVLPTGRGVAEPSAPTYSLDFLNIAPLFQLGGTTGTYRLLAFPNRRSAPTAKLELDSVAEGGTIAVDGPAVTVSARPDGRYTLLGITQVEESVGSYLSVSDVTMAAPWAVYAGRLTSPSCAKGGPLGCGDGNGVTVTSAFAGNQPQFGGYVLTMPGDDQTTGSLSVRLTTASPY